MCVVAGGLQFSHNDAAGVTQRWQKLVWVGFFFLAALVAAVTVSGVV